MLHQKNSFRQYMMAFFLVLFACNAIAQSQCGPPTDTTKTYGGGGGFGVPVINSSDPNEISGPVGYDTLRWVSVKDRMGFKVLFENDQVLATAPAQVVRITVPIHPAFNMNSLRLGSFGFGPYTFEVPPNRTYYAERLNPLEMQREQERILAAIRAAELEREREAKVLLRCDHCTGTIGRNAIPRLPIRLPDNLDTIPAKDSIGLLVDVIAGINVKKREIFWIFESLDPLTGRAPEEAFRGFLPVNDTLSGSGEGFVNFSIVPDQKVLTGDINAARTIIIFDLNEAIITNIWTNTVDALPQTSVMRLLLA